MLLLKISLLIITLLLYPASVLSQSVFISEENSIYEFLSCLSIKGIIPTYNDELKPHSRIYVASMLEKASSEYKRLTKIEIEELEFYKKEFAYELMILKKDIIEESTAIISGGESGRIRALSYMLPSFSIFADPVLGLDIKLRGRKEVIHKKSGADIYGYFGNNIGFSLNFSDNYEQGTFIDYNRSFSERTGYSFMIKRQNVLEYDNVNASLSYSWNYGSLTFAKDHLRWGSGNSGQIILSDKAPSFPMIRLEVSPANWIDFEYLIGYLNSDVVDSSSLRRNINKERNHYSMVPKYFAAHMLRLKPLQELTISLGESIVNSDSFEPVYLLPFIFFRIADHNMAPDQTASGNAQLFANALYNFKELNARLYGTVFVDELSVSGLLDGKPKGPSAVAYTLGGSFYDLWNLNFAVNLEYTRLSPFVYYHPDDAQTYANNSYQMGHWIGSNGDQIYIAVIKKIIRGLTVKTFYEYIRKGQKEVPSEPRHQPYQQFLYGLKTNYKNCGIGAQFEIIHSLMLKLDYCHVSISRQQNNLQFSQEVYDELSGGISFGF